MGLLLLLMCCMQLMKPPTPPPDDVGGPPSGPSRSSGLYREDSEARLRMAGSISADDEVVTAVAPRGNVIVAARLNISYAFDLLMETSIGAAPYPMLEPPPIPMCASKDDCSWELKPTLIAPFSGWYGLFCVSPTSNFGEVMIGDAPIGLGGNNAASTTSSSYHPRNARTLTTTGRRIVLPRENSIDGTGQRRGTASSQEAGSNRRRVRSSHLLYHIAVLLVLLLTAAAFLAPAVVVVVIVIGKVVLLHNAKPFGVENRAQAELRL
uniref:Uncharacterized protein n=1 Tax=Anopheles atroparvus TaxID=41427 RepID=A0A182JKT1_ANOAO